MKGGLRWSNWLKLSIQASRLLQKLRQLGDVGRDPPRLVRVSRMRRRAPAGLLLEIDVGERVPVVVPDDEAGVRLFGDLRRREAAGLGLVDHRNLR